MKAISFQQHKEDMLQAYAIGQNKRWDSLIQYQVDSYNSLPDAFTKEEIESVLENLVKKRYVNNDDIDEFTTGYKVCIREIKQALTNLRKGNEK